MLDVLVIYARLACANEPECPAKVVAPQRFLSWNNASADDAFAAVLACLAARFSFRDFPDFLDIVCRGDLSDIFSPLDCGGLDGPDSVTLLLLPGGGRYACDVGLQR